VVPHGGDTQGGSHGVGEGGEGVLERKGGGEHDGVAAEKRMGKGEEGGGGERGGRKRRGVQREHRILGLRESGRTQEGL